MQSQHARPTFFVTNSAGLSPKKSLCMFTEGTRFTYVVCFNYSMDFYIATK